MISITFVELDSEDPFEKSATVIVLFKAGSQIYIEDDTTFFLSLNFIYFSTYDENGDFSQEKALLIPTSIPQYGLTGRAPLHILTHADLRISEVLDNGKFSLLLLGSFTDDEYAKLNQTQISLKVYKTSLSLSKVDLFREMVDYNKYKFFLYLINLQNRSVIIGT